MVCFKHDFGRLSVCLRGGGGVGGLLMGFGGEMALHVIQPTGM